MNSASATATLWQPGLRLAAPLAITAGWFCVALGAAVIAGWWLDLPHVRGVVPGFVTMKMNTALCFVLGGATLLTAGGGSARPAIVRALTVAIAAVATTAVLQHLTGLDFGVDQLLVSDPEPTARSLPGRMSIVTAFCFLLFAVAMSLPQRSGGWGAAFSLLATTGLMLSALVLIGYLYRARALVEPLPATGVALHTAFGLAVLFSGALVSRPGVGWVRIALRAGGIGLILRVLLPTLLVLPVFLGWLGLQGLARDLYGPRGLLAWFVAATALLLIVITILITRTAAAVEDARRRQERLFSTVLRNSLDAFVMMDQVGRVLEWNGQAESIFGWSRREAVGQPLDLLIVPPDQRHAHVSGLARFLESGRQGPMILRRTLVSAVRRGGEAFSAELIIVPIDQEGRWSFAGFLRDVSQQLALEEQLRQSQKMDAIGQLTGGIAHDLNNLLTVVIGNLELLIARGDERHRGYAEPAMQAAERGAALVHRLLAFSRRQPLVPRPLALNELVDSVHALILRTLGEEVEIVLALGSDLWPVFADPNQVENALLNLAVNARDAMPDGGRLTIETANVRLDEDYTSRNPDAEPGEYVMLAVTDTGTGMAPDVLERAFEPFYTTKEVGKGSGLGLSMIYGFARQSRGHVKIYSELGHGTTVRVYLPRSDPVEPAAASDDSAEAPTLPPMADGRTILVVEDDDSVRAFVTLLLERWGYRVLSAADGTQAMAVLSSEAHVDLLFTDVVIPGGLSGRALAEAARALRPGLRVLYTSGYTRNTIVHQGKLDSDVDFIAKPYKREELADKLRRVLDDALPEL